MPDAIDYQRGAAVILLADSSGRDDAPIWKGSLAGAVRRVMAMTVDEQLRASIAIDEGVVPGTTLLRHKDIAELYQRPDFPREQG